MLVRGRRHRAGINPTGMAFAGNEGGPVREGLEQSKTGNSSG